MPQTFEIKIPFRLEIDPITITPVTVNANANIHADAKVTLVGDPDHPVAAQVQLIGDPERPVTAKVGLSMLLENFPIVSKEDMWRLLKRRIRLPLNFRFGMSVFPLNLFGVDAVQFSLCGEPQLILDDYVPNAYERCEAECEPCQP